MTPKLTDELRERLDFLIQHYPGVPDALTPNQLTAVRAALADRKEAMEELERVEHDLNAALQVCVDAGLGIDEMLTKPLASAMQIEKQKYRADQWKAAWHHALEIARNEGFSEEVRSRLPAELRAELEAK